MQVFYVWYEGWPYPIREKAPDSILVKLCNNGFECRSGLQCKYSHCEEELSYWRGTVGVLLIMFTVVIRILCLLAYYTSTGVVARLGTVVLLLTRECLLAWPIYAEARMSG